MESLCNQGITLLRATVTADAMGGEVRTYRAIATARARILADKGSLHDEMGRRTEIMRVQIVTPTDLGARVGDVIQDAAGNNYQVSSEADMGGGGRVYSIYATLLTPVS